MSIHSCSGVTYLLRPIYYLKRRNKNASILGIGKCECKSEMESEQPDRERLREKKIEKMYGNKTKSKRQPRKVYFITTTLRLPHISMLWSQTEVK